MPVRRFVHGFALTTVRYSQTAARVALRSPRAALATDGWGGGAAAQALHFKTLAYTPSAAHGGLGMDTVERVAAWRGQQQQRDDEEGGGGGGDGRCDAPTQLLTLRVSANYFAGDTGCKDWEAGYFMAELALSWPKLFAVRLRRPVRAGCVVMGPRCPPQPAVGGRA
jgi:hypothetical protein